MKIILWFYDFLQHIIYVIAIFLMKTKSFLFAMLTKYVWFSLDEFSKWPWQVSEMDTTACPNFCHAQVYVQEHLNSAGILHVQNLHVLGFMINFTCKRAVIPTFIIVLKLLITSSVSREFGFHIWYNLDEPACSTLWKRTLIMVYHKWTHFPSHPLKLSQFTPKNTWVTDPVGKQGRSSLTVAQSTQLESRRWTTVQVFPHRTLQKQSINSAMVCCKRHA